MRKIQTAISSDLCIRLTRNLTGTSWVVSHGGKTIPRWQTAVILKIDISPYHSEKSSDFHDVIKQELSYRKQIVRQLRTQFVEGISMTLKSTFRVTQGHWKRNHCTDHTRLTIRRVTGR